MKKAVIYLRTSSDRQEGNTSLDTQESLCRAYCQRENLDVVDTRRFEAVSAKTENAKRIAELLDYAKNNKDNFEILVVYKLDRFARDAQQHLWLRSELLKIGIILRSATENIDESSQGKFLETILAAVAQLDNDVRRERVSIGMWKRVEEGMWPWQPPTGYFRPHIQGVLLPLPEFDKSCSEAIKEIFELYSTGVYTLTTLGKLMHEKKIKNYRGRTIKFPNQTIHKILNTTFYIGYIKHKDGKMIKAQHAPLIDIQLWEKCQAVAIRQSHQIINKRLFYNPDFPLRKFTQCEYCTTPFTACWSKGRVEKYPYYYCRNKQCVKYGKMLSKKVLHDLFYEYLKFVKPKEEYIQLFHEVFMSRYQERLKEIKGEYLNKVDDVKKLEEEQLWLMDKGKKGVIPDAVLKTQLEDIEQKITLAQMSVQESHDDKLDIETLLNTAYTFIRTAHLAWVDAPSEIKEKYQRLIFPSGVFYANNGLSNRDIGLPYQLINDVGSSDPTNVDYHSALSNQIIDRLIETLTSWNVIFNNYKTEKAGLH